MRRKQIEARIYNKIKPNYRTRNLKIAYRLSSIPNQTHSKESSRIGFQHFRIGGLPSPWIMLQTLIFSRHSSIIIHHPVFEVLHYGFFKNMRILSIYTWSDWKDNSWWKKKQTKLSQESWKQNLTIQVREQHRRSLAAATWTEVEYLLSDRNFEDINSKNSSFSCKENKSQITIS